MRRTRMVILAVAPLLTAALWMDDQPSYRPYEPPVVAPPAGSVPFLGRGWERPGASNPVKPTPESLAQGKILFEINCVFCHGPTSAALGPVGSKLKPPPPGLDHAAVRRLSDSAIFTAITNGFGRMPPFRDKLTHEERWTLVTFLRTRQ